jgi:DNA polymerase III alpha subunit
MEAYEAEVRKFAPRRIRELQANNQAVVAGLILDIRTIKTQRGPMAVLTLDDGSGQIEATVYNDVFTEHRDLLQKDRIVLLDGRLQVDDFQWRSRDAHQSRSDRWNRPAKRECRNCASGYPVIESTSVLIPC